MLVCAVACVQYRNTAGKFGREARRAFLRMTHHNRIHIGADNRNGVRQGLAFFAQRCVATVGEAHYRRAQAVDRGFKGEAGTGRGFKEATGHHFMLQQFGLWIRLQARGGRQHQFQFFTVQIVNGNNVLLIERISHDSLLFRTAGKRRAKKNPSLRGFFMG